MRRSKSILFNRITPFFLVSTQVHVYYLYPTRREVRVRLFDGELRISPILVAWKKKR